MTKREKEKRNENLANDIYKFLLDNEMWIDTCIFYNGKCMATDDESEEGKRVYRYNGEPFIRLDDPHRYFDWVATPHILSMSFEGPLYEILNYPEDFPGLQEKFDMLFVRNGVYYELGDAWNLTCYEI